MPLPLSLLLAALPASPAALPRPTRLSPLGPPPGEQVLPSTPPLLRHGGAVMRQEGGALGTVENFDPVARARLIAEQMPRSWSGTYRDFSQTDIQPATLVIESARAEGQMVDLRGNLTIGGVATPVQGNLNAKSDQLDLLPLADELGGGLEAGGDFQGMQGFSLTGWNAPRLTSLGGRLQLLPSSQPAAAGPNPSTIRGLW